MFPERRSCVRHKVNGPVFASFDGVTGGMILDLSEQGLSMQTVTPLDTGPQADRRLHLRLDLPDSDVHLETTGYIAWADALGRAGVRFSELPNSQSTESWERVQISRAPPAPTKLDPFALKPPRARSNEILDLPSRPRFSMSSIRSGLI
jgi:hypothetical protein